MGGYGTDGGPSALRQGQALRGPDHGGAAAAVLGGIGVICPAEHPGQLGTATHQAARAITRKAR